MIDGHSRSAQPSMWREHFRKVFQSEEQPYQGDLLDDISQRISDDDISSFQRFNVDEISTAISDINTNKSYKRHCHWKSLLTENHAATQSCLAEVLNFFTKSVLSDDQAPDWDFFRTALDVIPKAGKNYPKYVSEFVSNIFSLLFFGTKAPIATIALH